MYDMPLVDLYSIFLFHIVMFQLFIKFHPFQFLELSFRCECTTVYFVWLFTCCSEGPSFVNYRWRWLCTVSNTAELGSRKFRNLHSTNTNYSWRLSGKMHISQNQLCEIRFWHRKQQVLYLELTVATYNVFQCQHIHKASDLPRR